jgi:hypothetical protein
VVVEYEETYETHYGLRDPMVHVLLRSFLHSWTIKGVHVRFVTYVEHTGKCKASTILQWSSATFYRWKEGEQEGEEEEEESDVVRELLSKHSTWTFIPSDLFSKTYLLINRVSH